MITGVFYLFIFTFFLTVIILLSYEYLGGRKCNSSIDIIAIIFVPFKILNYYVLEFLFFEKNVSCFKCRLHLFDQKFSKSSNIM